MVALMEKHKHQYDKTVDEKDTELEFHKTKLQELSSETESLKNELSCKKNGVFSLQEQLKREINEKENLAREVNQKLQASFVEIPEATSSDSLSVNAQKNIRQHFIPVNENIEYIDKSSWTPAKAYTKEEKRKVILELDSPSDSSGNTDLLSIVTEQEMFKKLNKDYSEFSHLCFRTPKQIQAPSILKTLGSSMKLATVRKITFIQIKRGVCMEDLSKKKKKGEELENVPGVQALLDDKNARFLCVDSALAPGHCLLPPAKPSRKI
ncbi:Synaptonemal complex protein 1, partial [Ophiophagus hannah]